MKRIDVIKQQYFDETREINLTQLLPVEQVVYLRRALGRVKMKRKYLSIKSVVITLDDLKD